MIRWFICAAVYIGLLRAIRVSSQTVCGSDNETELEALNYNVEKHADLLLSRRDSEYGWRNTPEAVTALLLSSPERFSNLDASVSRMQDEIRVNGSKMSPGKFSQYLLAAKAACKNVSNFGGGDLVTELKNKLDYEFISSDDGEPDHGWYSYYLAVGAYCISQKRSPGDSYVQHILDSQKRHGGGFHDVESVDYTAQAMLTLACIERTSEISDDMERKVNHAVNDASKFLKSKIVTERDESWIGNRYATPFALIAMMENSKWRGDEFRCKAILNSLNGQSITLEPEAALSQALPTLKGVSSLSLMNENRECPNPDIEVILPESTHQPLKTSRTIISVNITVRPYAYRVGHAQHHEISRYHFDDIRKGTTLYNIMLSRINFRTKETAWGKSLVSINGFEADGTKKQFWSIEANGEQAPVGIEQFIPSHNDHIVLKRITWG